MRKTGNIYASQSRQMMIHVTRTESLVSLRQAYTDRQTDIQTITLIAIFRTPIGGEVKQLSSRAKATVVDSVFR